MIIFPRHSTKCRVFIKPPSMAKHLLYVKPYRHLHYAVNIYSRYTRTWLIKHPLLRNLWKQQSRPTSEVLKSTYRYMTPWSLQTVPAVHDIKYTVMYGFVCYGLFNGALSGTAWLDCLLGRMWKGSVMVKFKALWKQLAEVTEKNHEQLLDTRYYSL